MKLSHKKDVRRVGENFTPKKFFLFGFIFKIFSLFKKKKPQSHTKHKISPLKKKGEKHNLHKRNLFGVTKYKKEEQGTKGQARTRGAFSFIVLIAIFFTCCTVFYFQQVSSKLLHTKEGVVELYQRYQAIHNMNQKAKTFLKVMKDNKNITGTLYMLVDEEGYLLKEEKSITQKYYDNIKEVEGSSIFSYERIRALILSSLVVLFCFIARMYSLFAHKKKVLQNFSSLNQWGGFLSPHASK